MKPLVAIVVSLVVLAVLRPWTIRPIGDVTHPAFDAASFVSSAWPKLVQEANETALDISAIPSGTGPLPKARFVKGLGMVSAIDRNSRVGMLRLQIVNGGPTVAIQIGPVIRGTALRDASSFIQFSNFTNQFDYAGAANALNDYALENVIAPVPIATLLGRVVTFVGAVSSSPRREDGAIEVVPVRLAVSIGAAN
jgi:predicted lipoprotein